MMDPEARGCTLSSIGLRSSSHPGAMVMSSARQARSRSNAGSTGFGEAWRQSRPYRAVRRLDAAADLIDGVSALAIEVASSMRSACASWE